MPRGHWTTAGLDGLRALASDPISRVRITEEGGLEPLALGARTVQLLLD